MDPADAVLWVRGCPVEYVGFFHVVDYDPCYGEGDGEESG